LTSIFFFISILLTFERVTLRS